MLEIMIVFVRESDVKYFHQKIILQRFTCQKPKLAMQKSLAKYSNFEYLVFVCKFTNESGGLEERLYRLKYRIFSIKRINCKSQVNAGSTRPSLK